MIKKISLNLAIILFILPLGSAAHYIVGIVENAKDGTSANGQSIVLWNPDIGIQENVSDIIGPAGNSRTNNIYMIDCELLPSGCNVTNTLSLKVINNGDNYISQEKNVSVGGFGYDIVENITLNSPPNITLVNVDDSITSPQNEIDLIPAETKEVICSAIIYEYEGEESLINATGRFFDNVQSNYGSLEDNNEHYRNNSCLIDKNYGGVNEAAVYCSFYIWYYSNSENWNCTIEVTDNLSISSRGSDLSFINPLLALGVESIVTFNLTKSDITDEAILDVTNYGNVKINLSLSGYAFEQNDGLAMNCSEGEIRNIPVENEKYNLTNSNSGDITFEEFMISYKNLTSYPAVNKFNLEYRKDDLLNEATKSTYWRIHVPDGITGNCQGNIVFGAVRAPGD